MLALMVDVSTSLRVSRDTLAKVLPLSAFGFNFPSEPIRVARVLVDVVINDPIYNSYLVTLLFI